MSRLRLLLSLLITSLSPLITINSNANPSMDTREELFLADDDIAYMNKEMQRFLYVIQQVTEGMKNNDMSQISHAAKAMGTSSVRQVPGDLKSALPMDFKKMGYATRRTFEQLAMDAEQLGDKEHTLSQLNEILTLCTACHSRYKVQ